MTAIILAVLRVVIVGGLLAWGCHWKLQAIYWRENAVKQGKKRLTGDDRAKVESQTINQRAAHQIFLLNEEIERVLADNRRLRNINRNLLKQMDRRNAG